MAVVRTGETEYEQELHKWNKPYRYEPFPKMIYRGVLKANGKHDFEDMIVHSDRELAERMADGHRSAARVDPVHIRVVLAGPGRHDGGEGLVDLDEVDVAHRHRVALQQLRGGRDRPLEHLHRVAADGGLVDDHRAGCQAELVGLLAGHQQHRGGAVGDLRGVARGDLAVRLEGRLKLAELLERRLGANALVGDDLLAVDLHHDHLALELALLGGLVGQLVGAQGELVEFGAGNLPLVGDHLGAEALADDVVLLHQLGREGSAVLLLDLHSVTERVVAHVLDSGADDDVVDAGGDQGGAVVGGLLGRAALGVDGRGGRLDREALLQPRVAADVEGLLAVLLDAPGDDGLHLAGVDAAALDDLRVAGAEKVVGMGVLVITLLAVPAPDRSADCFDDYDFAAILHWRSAPSFDWT